MAKHKKSGKHKSWLDYKDSCAITGYSPLSDEFYTPLEMRLSGEPPDGIVFGTDPNNPYDNNLVGINTGDEGNITVIGGSGSGKTAGIVKPTVMCFSGRFFVTDTKGDISKFYELAYEHYIVDTPAIVFDLEDPSSIGYDPFHHLRDDGDQNLISNVIELAYCLFPEKLGVVDPFWRNMARNILAAAILYYFKLGTSFSDTILLLFCTSLEKLNDEIRQSQNESAKLLLGDLSNMDPKVKAGLEAELKSELINFAADPYITHAFRGNNEGAECFTWDDLQYSNIFLRVPENRLTQWGPAIKLLYTQLFRYLMRRPDKYSQEGRKNVPILLLMDEFAQYGRIPHMTQAISTLRSRNVNICIMIQSIAQLDAIYGVDERKIILDNCSFKAILQVNDPESQSYLSNLIGTHLVYQNIHSNHYDFTNEIDSSSTQESKTREYRVLPHELALLKDVLVVSPYGFFRLNKVPYQFMPPKRKMSIFIEAKDISEEEIPPNTPRIHGQAVLSRKSTKRNDVKMMSTEERIVQTKYRDAESAQQVKRALKQERETQKKKDQRRNYIIGELVARYFPEVAALNPGTNEQNAVIFKRMEAILYILANDQSLLEQLRGNADKLVSSVSEEQWRMSTDTSDV